MPQTRLCAEHARLIAQYGGEFRATATAEGTGQKTGRGVVAVNQIRNAEALAKLRADYENATGPEGQNQTNLPDSRSGSDNLSR